MIFWLMLLAQAQSGPWEKYRGQPCEGCRAYGPNGQTGVVRNGQIVVDPERLGPGPHTLVVSDGRAMDRREYRSGRLCQAARDSVLRQVREQNPGLIAGGPSAICIPR